MPGGSVGTEIIGDCVSNIIPGGCVGPEIVGEFVSKTMPGGFVGSRFVVDSVVGDPEVAAKTGASDSDTTMSKGAELLTRIEGSCVKVAGSGDGSSLGLGSGCIVLKMTPGGSVGIGKMGETVSKKIPGGGVICVFFGADDGVCAGATLSCPAGGSDFSSL